MINSLYIWKKSTRWKIGHVNNFKQRREKAWTKYMNIWIYEQKRVLNGSVKKTEDSHIILANASVKKN